MASAIISETDNVSSFCICEESESLQIDFANGLRRVVFLEDLEEAGVNWMQCHGKDLTIFCIINQIGFVLRPGAAS
jgi:arabinogalactan endo-1,4-beta-galactosidase